MRQDFPLPPVLFELHRVFIERGRSLFLVGGAVRNLVLGFEPKDWDLCSDAPPEEVQTMFKRVIPTGIEHGTVTVLHRGEKFEITTFRLDGAYSDSRRPDSVTYTSDIVEDLARRDFTMNAMAINLATGELLDPFKGQTDLEAAIIRTVGDPLVRFDEDGLRIARAIRFSAQLGFRIEDDTWNAIPERLEKLNGVSVERFRDEFLKTLHAPHGAMGIELFADSGALNHFLPELLRRFDLGCEHAPDTDVLSFGAAMAKLLPKNHDALRLAALFAPIPPLNVPAEDVTAILRRLKMPVITIRDCGLFCENLAPLPSDREPDAALRHRFARIGKEKALLLTEFQRAWHEVWVKTGGAKLFDNTEYQERTKGILAANPALSIKELKINGEVLQRQLGIGPSPLLGILLNRLMDEVLEEPELNTEGSLLARAALIYGKLTDQSVSGKK